MPLTLGFLLGLCRKILVTASPISCFQLDKLLSSKVNYGFPITPTDAGTADDILVPSPTDSPPPSPTTSPVCLDLSTIPNFLRLRHPFLSRPIPSSSQPSPQLPDPSVQLLNCLFHPTNFSSSPPLRLTKSPIYFSPFDIHPLQYPLPPKNPPLSDAAMLTSATSRLQALRPNFGSLNEPVSASASDEMTRHRHSLQPRRFQVRPDRLCCGSHCCWGTRS